MKIERIYNIEQKKNFKLHLFKDGIFWKAYEKSAFMFYKNLKSYKIFKHKYETIKREMVFLGFPNSYLAKIKEIALSKKLEVKDISEKHIVIKGLSFDENEFLEWKKLRNNHTSLETLRKEKAKFFTRHSEEYSFKLLYELSIYSLNLLPKINNKYKFTLGEPLIRELIGLCKHFYASPLKTKKPIEEAKEKLYEIQIQFRMLTSLRLISIKQFRHINKQITEILNSFSAFGCSRTTEETTKEESSILPATVSTQKG